MSLAPRKVQPNEAASARTPGLDGPWLGYVFVLTTALVFGTAPTLAAVAFLGGADAFGLQVIRFTITAGVILASNLLLGHGIRVARAHRLHLLGLAATTSVASVGYMTAVLYVPVALASLTFFSFPVMVALLLHLLRLDPLDAARALGVAASFAGLVMVLGAGLSDLHPLGISLAFLAGSSVAVSFLITRSLAGAVPPLTMVLYSTGLPTLLLWLVLPLVGAVALPDTAAGWAGAIGNGLCYAAGLLGLYAAIGRLGPLPVASAINLEPLVSVAAAYLLLGQSLSPIQFAGALVVVAGIVVVQRRAAAGKKIPAGQ